MAPTMTARAVITHGVNLAKIAVTLPVAVVGLAVGSVWHDRSVDPENVTNGRTPVLLIHGSESNQQQFLLFRRRLEGADVGHTFAVNLNKRARRNDDDRDILDYVSPVHQKLVAMKDLYQRAGYAMDKVILLGNSMGGLVAAAYCVTSLIPDKLCVSAVISISTPWKGSHMGDLFCSADRFPEKYFRRESEDRERLVRSFISFARQHNIPVYNYGSIFDIHVTPSSAQLEELAPEGNRLIDSRNDHLTTMLDFSLASYIRDQWVRPNTQESPPAGQTK